MAQAIGLEPNANAATVLQTLRDKSPSAIFVDDAQRLIRPLIGGLRDIDRLVNFAREVGATTSWVVSIGAPAWQYLRRARGDRALFDEVVELQSWSEEAIRSLTRGIANKAGISPRFDELVVPRQMYDAQYTNTERSERDYCRILWDYSDGNPFVAGFFWKESLAMKDEDCFVRLFKPPSLSGLEGSPGSLHFVLRATLQLELASEQDIVRCTDLHPADVADALRVARGRGYTEAIGPYIRISPRWYRAVIRFLRRQHLLVAQ